MRQALPTFASPFRPPPGGSRALLIATAAVSLLAMLDYGWIGIGLHDALAFSPAKLAELKLHTAVTYLFVEPSPLGLLLHLFIGLWMFGVPVEYALGTRRYLAYFFWTGIGGALVTALLAFVFPGLRHAGYDGTYVVMEAMVLAWVLLHWNAQVLLFVLPVKAQHLLYLALLIPGLSILLGQVAPFVPVLAGMGLGYLFLAGPRGPRRLWLRLSELWLRQRLRYRSSRLRVIAGKKNGASRDPYLN